MSFTRLLRFLDAEGTEHLGEAGPWRQGETLIGKVVPTLSGDPFSILESTGREAEIKELLYPLKSTPVFMCIGINYQRHADESGLKPPRDPAVFMKPADALANPGEVIPIPVRLQKALDYEGELCVVIGKDCKDVSEERALDYVLGYAAGNDISAREFQKPEVCGWQFCYAKSFDKFAPIGPCIASPAAIPDPRKLQLKTMVNGATRQHTGTDDLIWSIQKIIAYVSNGITLRKGTVIMTGTPSGVAVFMGSEDAYLKDGDVVDVEISGIGTLSNKMKF